MVLGPDKFGEVYFLGTVPSDPADLLGAQNDVLVATHDATESHFHFAPDGTMKKMEMFPTVQPDPCEVEFSNFANGLPTSLTIRYADNVIETLSNLRFKVAAPLNAGS